MFPVKATRIPIRRAATAAAIVFVVAAAGCARQANPNSTAQQATAHNNSGQTYYWISQDSTLPLFVQHDYVGWKLAAKQLGVTAKMVGPTNINLPQFISTIEQICAQHPAGVSVVGWDPSEAAAVNQCLSEGVPVVTDDADLPNSNRLAFVGTNWYDIGYDQAKAMAQALPHGGQVATTSIINAANMVLARQGFIAGLKGTGITVVANEDDGGDPAQAATKASSLLAAYPHLAGIAGFDAESGIGIVQALQQSGKAGKVKVTCVEQTPQFYKNLQTGVVSAIVVQKRELFTYWALQLLYAYHSSGLSVSHLSKATASPIPLNVDTGLIVITKANVSEMLKADHVS